MTVLRRASRTVLLACLIGASPLAVSTAADAPFRIGIVSRGIDDARVVGLSSIETAFRRALGRDVEVYVARDFAFLIDAHIAGRVDYAVYSTQAFAAAQLRCGCLKPIAAPVASDGSIGIRSLLKMRTADSRTESTRRLAVGGKDSLATHLVPLALSDAARDARAAGRLVVAGSAGAARAMYENGDVDGYYGWEPVMPADRYAPSVDLAADPDRQTIVEPWLSDRIPYGPHAVRADLDDELASAVLAALNGRPWETASAGSLLDPRSAGRFIAVSLDDYRPAIAAVSLLAQDQNADE